MSELNRIGYAGREHCRNFTVLSSHGELFCFTWDDGQEFLIEDMALRWAMDDELCFSIADCEAVCAIMYAGRNHTEGEG